MLGQVSARLIMVFSHLVQPRLDHPCFQALELEENLFLIDALETYCSFVRQVLGVTEVRLVKESRPAVDRVLMHFVRKASHLYGGMRLAMWGYKNWENQKNWKHCHYDVTRNCARGEIVAGPNGVMSSSFHLSCFGH